ncbi:MAG: type II toxin-antitoxin system HicA family toxin [Actinomycetota bacterium]
MTGKEVLRILLRLDCEVVRQRGSHVRVACGECHATVPIHAGRDIAPGTLRNIERSIEPCRGARWLRTGS